MNLNPVPSKTAKERAPANSKAGAPGVTRKTCHSERNVESLCGFNLKTEGKDLDHARSMAKDAIQCYIEGLKKAKEPIPVEKETAQLRISVVA